MSTEFENISTGMRSTGMRLTVEGSESTLSTHPSRTASTPCGRLMANKLEVARLGTVKGQTVLWFKGALTRDNDSLFLSAVRREDNISTLILDLTDVPYIDSTGLGTLVSAYVSRHRMGKQVALSGVSDQVSNTLKITRLESLFILVPTLEDALTQLDQAN
jgi:anti-anti-sigma factor